MQKHGNDMDGLAETTKTTQAAIGILAEAAPTYDPKHTGHAKLAKALLGSRPESELEAIGREALSVLVLLEPQLYRLGHAQQDAIRDTLRKARAASIIDEAGKVVSQ